MSAEPVPEVGLLVPATAFDMGHPLRYVLRLVPDDAPDEPVYRSNCGCHRWWWIEPIAGEAAWLRGQR